MYIISFNFEELLIIKLEFNSILHSYSSTTIFKKISKFYHRISTKSFDPINLKMILWFHYNSYNH